MNEDEKKIEEIAELVHNSWMEEKKKQDFHNPKDCMAPFDEDEPFAPCTKCHNDIKPYQELSEKVKELDRVMVRGFYTHLNSLGLVVVSKENLKHTKFVEHIEAHLKNDQEVLCKICDKSVEEIWKYR